MNIRNSRFRGLRIFVLFALNVCRWGVCSFVIRYVIRYVVRYDCGFLSGTALVTGTTFINGTAVVSCISLTCYLTNLFRYCNCFVVGGGFPSFFKTKYCKIL